MTKGEIIRLEQQIKEALTNATPRPWKWDLKKRDEKEDWNIFVQGLSHWKNAGMPKSGISILDVSPNQHGIHVITAGNEADIDIIENSPVWLEWCLSQIEGLKKENEQLKANQG